MKIFIVVIISLLTTELFAQSAGNVEHRVWNKAPIHIVLPVGTERRVDFPLSVQLQVPALLRSLSDRIQVSESGSVYWLARKPFGKHRVNAITDTGYSYVLDVEARTNNTHNHPIIIVDDRIPVDTPSNNADNTLDYDYVDLARLASQSIYAPKRLIKPLPGVRRIAVDTSWIPLFKGGELNTAPVAQWVASTVPSLYVTAVKVISDSISTTTLDPRDIRGKFLAAVSQHAFVTPTGTDDDTTYLYLISDRPFGEVTL